MFHSVGYFEGFKEEKGGSLNKSCLEAHIVMHEWPVLHAGNIEDLTTTFQPCMDDVSRKKIAASSKRVLINWDIWTYKK